MEEPDTTLAKLGDDVGSDYVRTLVRTYLDGLPSRIEALNAAASPEEVRGLAHPLKSTGGMLGLSGLSAAARAAEQDQQNARALVEALEASGPVLEAWMARSAEGLSAT